jgi:hypothetical protein
VSRDRILSVSSASQSKKKSRRLHRNYFQTENIVYDLHGPALGAYGIAVYGVLCRHAGANTECWPGLDEIARTLDISRKKVWTALGQLTKLGLITTKRPRKCRKSCTYQLKILDPANLTLSSTSTKKPNSNAAVVKITRTLSPSERYEGWISS